MSTSLPNTDLSERSTAGSLLAAATAAAAAAAATDTLAILGTQMTVTPGNLEATISGCWTGASLVRPLRGPNR